MQISGGYVLYANNNAGKRHVTVYIPSAVAFSFHDAFVQVESRPQGRKDVKSQKSSYDAFWSSTGQLTSGTW